MTENALRALVTAGELERVDADAELAMVELADAKNHLQSATKLVNDDPVMAYTALYDAARKAVAAHMRARGYRARGKFGFHVKTVRYAEAALSGTAIDDDLERFDEMRSIRNDAEYGGRRIGRAEVRADLATAQRIVAAIDRILVADGAA